MIMSMAEQSTNIRNSFLNYLKLEDMGIYTAYDDQNQSIEKLEELYQFGKNLICEEKPPVDMTLEEFLDAFGPGKIVRQGSEVSQYLTGFPSRQSGLLQN